MATPVGDSYSVASGGVIAAGRNSLPSWVPAVGAIANVSLNTLQSVSGTEDAYWIRSIMDHWSGCAFAKDYGALGSLIFTGGGHDAGKSNSVFRYDVATRLFSRIKTPATPINVLSNEYIADPTTGWMWLDDAKTTLQNGEPFAAHMYANIVGLPANAIAGAANGWLISAGRVAMPRAGSGGTPMSQKLRLGEDNLFTHHGTAMPNGGSGYGPSVYDPVRGRLLSFFGAERSSYSWLNLSTEAVGSTNFASGTLNGYYATAFHDADNDLFYVINVSPTYDLKILNPATNALFTPATSGTAPTSSGGWEWVESWGCLVFYPGSGGNVVWTLKRPSDPIAGTWSWGSQTLTGTPLATNGEAPHYTRFRWIEKAQSFLWASRTENAIQAFRLSRP